MHSNVLLIAPDVWISDHAMTTSHANHRRADATARDINVIWGLPYKIPEMMS